MTIAYLDKNGCEDKDVIAHTRNITIGIGCGCMRKKSYKFGQQWMGFAAEKK